MTKVDFTDPPEDRSEPLGESHTCAACNNQWFGNIEQCPICDAALTTKPEDRMWPNTDGLEGELYPTKEILARLEKLRTPGLKNDFKECIYALLDRIANPQDFIHEAVWDAEHDLSILVDGSTHTHVRGNDEFGRICKKCGKDLMHPIHTRYQP